ncbi:hypothetical protein DKX38_017745 [Salix brachista]|uniref:Leucine-rich repeat-containing N-terminal plant-type domain-containing protein n=1 Tax=Salix brachista TaxID=2182728 RepID=A0A5N5KW36_9ROSI|nr:hypothetical protein DKX38_017745 [Salix brachista]
MDRVLKTARSSGSLNLSNRSLREVPEEVYKILDAVGEGEKWWENVELQKLILAHNSIESIKEDLKNLSQLTVLNVSHNQLSALPAAIGELPMLKLLDVSFNLIQKVPDEIGSATSLVKFDCSSNQLRELPSSLGGCLDLSDLKASNNSITSLPEDLARCSKLTKVDVEGNKLKVLSGNLMASWTMLTEFNASKNLLSDIPDNFGSLSRLIRLDLHQNRISTIPPSIMGCCSLAEFYMGLNNALSTLPAEIGALSRLGTLDLHSNQLKEIPVEACKLQLSMLDLSNNSLTVLPPELGKMTTLRKLLLNGNPLRSLRSSLVSGPTATLLKYLQSRLSEGEDSKSTTPAKKDLISMTARLSVSSKNVYNTVSSSLLSTSFLSKEGILEISLQGLGLSSVPSEVWESNEIVKADLSRNSIQELPVELSFCVSLQATNFCIKVGLLSSLNLKFVFSLWNILQKLFYECLILSRNKISDWPFAVLKSLPNLLCLKLDNNALTQATLCAAGQDLNIGNFVVLMGMALNSVLIVLPLFVFQYVLLTTKVIIPSDGFQAVPMLQILDLSGNPASLLAHPAFSSLPHLKELYLRQVQLREIPSDILSLQQLQVLNLSQNSLHSIPEGFKNLSSLTELDLSDNNISALPPELGLLEPSLQALRLDGNPLRSIRRTILDRGTKAVLKYLMDKLPEH